MILVFKGGIPAKKALESSSSETYVVNGSKIFFYYLRGQFVDIIGFFTLLTGAIFAYF